jgi:hypothetical protein
MRALAVIALLLGAAEARAAPSAEAEVILQLLESHRAGEAYRRVAPLLVAHPEDSYLEYLAAMASFHTARTAEAMEHVERGLRIKPESIVLLAVRARLRLLEGDLVGARADVARVLATDPADADAAEMQAQLDTIEVAQARLGESTSRYAVGSPSWIVDRFLERAFAGAGAVELSVFIHPDVLQDVPEDARTPGLVVAYLARLIEQIESKGAFQSYHVEGWTILGSPPLGDDAWVQVSLVYEQDITRETALKGATVNLDSIFSDLELEERAEAADRLTGRRFREIMPVDFILGVSDHGFRIREVRVGGRDLQRPLRGLDARILAYRMAAEASNPWRFVGPLLLFGVLVAVVFWLVFARTGRRNR